MPEVNCKTLGQNSALLTHQEEVVEQERRKHGWKWVGGWKKTVELLKRKTG